MNPENLIRLKNTAKDFSIGEDVIWVVQHNLEQMPKLRPAKITQMGTKHCTLSVLPDANGGNFRTPIVKYSELSKKKVQPMANDAKVTRLLDYAEELAGIDYLALADLEAPEVFSRMKAEGIVAAYGFDDNQLRFEGAIDDVVPMFEGGVVYLTAEGIIENKCDCLNCYYYDQLTEKALPVVVEWNEKPDEGEPTWEILFKIERVFRFMVHEDGEPFSRGVIFYLNDVKKPDDEEV